MSHAMYAVVRHTAGQTRVIRYTFQPQNPQIRSVPQLNQATSPEAGGSFGISG